MAIWNILWSFGIFFPVLVCCTKENLATLTAVFHFTPTQKAKVWREKEPLSQSSINLPIRIFFRVPLKFKRLQMFSSEIEKPLFSGEKKVGTLQISRNA
jgi:hypothetical protein